MSGIQGTGNKNATVSDMYSTTGVDNIQSTNTLKGTSASQDVPTTSDAASSTKPLLLAPGNTDFAAAQSFAAAYTELIVLMCEVNRDSYEANREVAQTQMDVRIGQLESAAKKRMTAAIVGLAFGVISSAVGIAGGISGMKSTTKNLGKLNELRDATKGATMARNDATKLSEQLPELKNTAKIKRDDATMAESNLTKAQDTLALKKSDLEKAQGDVQTAEKKRASAKDKDTDAAQKELDAAREKQNLAQEDVALAEKDVALKKADAKTLKEKATQAEGNYAEKEQAAALKDDHATAAENHIAQNQRFDMGVIENTTARTNAKTMVFNSLKEAISASGQGGSAIISSEADTLQASAEETEADRQLSVGNMQQFQELMSKFNSILASFLEAEINAASAAAKV